METILMSLITHQGADAALAALSLVRHGDPSALCVALVSICLAIDTAHWRRHKQLHGTRLID